MTLSSAASICARLAAVALGLGPIGAGAPALAHHSFAMFDFSRTVTLKGVVKELQWTNPHVIVWVETTPGPGRTPEVWSAELTSPGNLTRNGWTKRTLKPGDKVEVDVSPLRDGGHGGGFRRVVLVDTGQVLTSDLRAQGRPTAP
jgi:hypothetical protein